MIRVLGQITPMVQVLYVGCTNSVNSELFKNLTNKFMFTYRFTDGFKNKISNYMPEVKTKVHHFWNRLITKKMAGSTNVSHYINGFAKLILSQEAFIRITIPPNTTTCKKIYNIQ